MNCARPGCPRVVGVDRQSHCSPVCRHLAREIEHAEQRLESEPFSKYQAIVSELEALKIAAEALNVAFERRAAYDSPRRPRRGKRGRS